MLLHRHIIHAGFGPDAGLQWGLSVLVRALDIVLKWMRLDQPARCK